MWPFRACAMKKYAIWPIFVAESPTFLHLIGNRGRRTQRCVRFLTGSRNMAVSRTVRNETICNLAHIYGRIAKIPASYRKSGSVNTMVTSDFFTGSRNVAVSRMRNEKYAIWPLFITESPKFPRLRRKRGRGTPW